MTKMHKKHLDIAPFRTREEKCPFVSRFDKLLHRSSWQCLTKELSVDIFTGLTALGLDGNTNPTGRSQLSRVKERHTKHLIIMKNASRGKTLSFIGKRKDDLYSFFKRYFSTLKHSFINSFLFHLSSLTKGTVE